MSDCSVNDLNIAFFELRDGRVTDMNPAAEKLLHLAYEAGIKNFKKMLADRIAAGDVSIRLQHREFGIKVITPSTPLRVLVFGLDEFRPSLEELFDISSFQHEMKNPLTVIDGTSQLILAKASDDYIKKCAGIILNETQRIKHMLQNIRLLSGMVLEYAEFEVKSFLEEMLNSLSVLFPDIKLSVQVEPNLSSVYADKKKLFMAVNNILKNACEAQKSGQVALHIGLDPTIKYVCKASGQAVPMMKISISDTGSGIPEETLTKLFTPFFTTKNRGTGLGLVIAKEITEKHKGRIEVQSTMGMGTTFSIYIPMIKP
ncbi:nitrogen regulation protein NR(II) [Seleniivibrio woodruffii]|uniref:two-component system sensor histidine kinase NtrB n=1 Tax=Seleniivibrio woodruffii TaxID=1078050 RepID=UPI0026EE5E4D|nr:ATP-binding protein [Seleniivibrio woodruffii]